MLDPRVVVQISALRKEPVALTTRYQREVVDTSPAAATRKPAQELRGDRSAEAVGLPRSHDVSQSWAVLTARPAPEALARQLHRGRVDADPTAADQPDDHRCPGGWVNGEHLTLDPIDRGQVVEV
jgi:hypothetical protein